MRPRPSSLRCPYCHETLAAEPRASCWSCGALHHRDCWTETGCCASCAGERGLATPTTKTRPGWDRARVGAALLALLLAPLALPLFTFTPVGAVVALVNALEGPERWHNVVEGISLWAWAQLLCGLPWLVFAGAALWGQEATATWLSARRRGVARGLAVVAVSVAVAALANSAYRAGNSEAAAHALGWSLAALGALGLNRALRPGALRPEALRPRARTRVAAAGGAKKTLTPRSTRRRARA